MAAVAIELYLKSLSAERDFRYSSIATAAMLINGRVSPEPGGWSNSFRAFSNWSAASRT
jgi:hypothetical protein